MIDGADGREIPKYILKLTLSIDTLNIGLEGNAIKTNLLYYLFEFKGY